MFDLLLDAVQQSQINLIILRGKLSLGYNFKFCDYNSSLKSSIASRPWTGGRLT
jgi:hypothetical protein